MLGLDCSILLVLTNMQSYNHDFDIHRLERINVTSLGVSHPKFYPIRLVEIKGYYILKSV